MLTHVLSMEFSAHGHFLAAIFSSQILYTLTPIYSDIQ